MTAPPAGWDDVAVRSPGGHVLQSAAWAEIREAQGWRAEFLRLGDPLPVALVLWRSLAGGLRLGYAPRGPILAEPKQLAGALAKLQAHARERRAIFLKVDPELDPDLAGPPLSEAGFRRGPDIQPVLATLQLDLAPSEEALLAAMEKDTRWSIRQAEKRGVRIVGAIAGDDGLLNDFYGLYATTGARAGFIIRTRSYYEQTWGALIDARLADLSVAYVGEAPVAGAMVWRCGDRAVYQSAATNDAGRKSYAAYALLWSCIIEAKREGKQSFDFGGIPGDLGRKDDPMYGPYLFKKGFGGQPRRFVGAHDAVPNPLLYHAYRIAEPIYIEGLRLAGRLRR